MVGRRLRLHRIEERQTEGEREKSEGGRQKKDGSIIQISLSTHTMQQHIQYTLRVHARIYVHLRLELLSVL